MKRRLLWKLCLIIATGVVAFFYLVSMLTSRTEEGMSMLDDSHRAELRAWGETAEQLYLADDPEELEQWLTALGEQEQTWVSVASFSAKQLAGEPLGDLYSDTYHLGRSVDWKVHLYFEHNPVMELPFSDRSHSLLVKLPERMRPGLHWQLVKLAMQIIVPMIFLAILSLILYRHIMHPLGKLQSATRHFSQGNLDVRVANLLGNRKDELSELANTFDVMASRIGELITNQRQLIADLSHELRTPLTRLDIAVAALAEDDKQENIARIERESQHIRKLVDDTLTLAWLENERPELQHETLDLVDLIDVVAEDARFEFPDRQLKIYQPDSAIIANSNHRAVGQALENIVRNAMRHTPKNQQVTIALLDMKGGYKLTIDDDGPGVPEQYLEAIFQPVFRVDQSRGTNSDSFGLGLALARRQLNAVQGQVIASNRAAGGLSMQILLPA
ncbi:histidine kinase sensor domain-containing protein [Neiella marina]|uniref:histidine kinase n=1 Tax=Neiella holothuriorum TaxID=2870530 RepID=A0ABS7EEH3_9GAMM|nr:histidine kinase sensor domain-containing protein [Neiella holothuriorum]MBW8190619.1 histidine kinase sensor domain-containing protein [Neiella holothuriorum]